MKHLCALIAGIAATSAFATVQPLDLDGNGSYDVFLDRSTSLLWSNADVFGAKTFASAEAAVHAATIEGLSDWLIPTRAQFSALYATQGSTGGKMNEWPFTGLQYTWYWTSEVNPANSAQHLAFSPTGNNTNPYFDTTPVNTWAVTPASAVPEPGTAGLALAGLAAMTLGGCLRRRWRSGARVTE